MFLNFREWFLINEGQWLRADKIASLGQGRQSAFFLFDDKPVVAIDFRLELMGVNKLNSISGSRWFCKIPEKVNYTNREVVYCEPMPGAGPYIIINRFYQGPQQDPLVSLSKSLGVGIKQQMELEIKQRASRNHGRGEYDLVTNDVQQGLKELEQMGYKNLYTKLPDDWLTYATITLKNINSQPQAVCRECGGSGRIDNDTLDGEVCGNCNGSGQDLHPNIIPFETFETIDLFERTHMKVATA